ncbi:RidA family protein [Halorubellus sp. JP-L1]|uniref:RidA family protein n=1 Tax=Halorubellus sp. JP-L1 TaxID=2715753 RepID=UPI00140930EE|nr:RidA family protein [Halorubellus sp. JP-L1]NHN42883.1 RidA family protein [Halorubellus sp. JP-L1]
MEKEILNPDGLAPPRGFNHGIKVSGGDLLFLAGQDGADETETIVDPDDVVAQFEQVLENLQTVVQEAGGTMNDIVKLNVFVADRDEYVDALDDLGEVFSGYFDDYPTMALFEVSGFFKEDARIELEGMAVVDDSS